MNSVSDYLFLTKAMNGTAFLLVSLHQGKRKTSLIPDDSDVQVPILGDTDVRDDREVESINEVRTDNSTPCTKDNVRIQD